MSEKSKKQLLDYYKNEPDFRKRKKVDLKKLVENEAALATKLGELYKNDPKGLKLALETFPNMDFMEKQRALKEHEKLVAETKDKNELHKKLLVKAAHTKIDEAAKKHTLSDKTRKRYNELFSNEANYKNPQTQKPGDLQTLEKMYEILVSPNPQPEHKNLAAYEQRRKLFQEKVKNLGTTNPNLDKTKLAEWQKKYDEEGWSKREKITQELDQETLSQKEKHQKTKEQEKKAGIKESDKKEAKEGVPKRLEVINAATLHMADNNPKEALRLLMLYQQKDPYNKQVLLLIELAARQLRERGNATEKEVSLEKQLEAEMKAEVHRDGGQIHDLVEQERITTLSIEGAKQSERRHDKQKSAKKRAERESVGKTAGNADHLEEDLIKDYYKQTDKKHILGDNQSGKEVQQIKFNEINMNREQRKRAKERTYREQGRLNLHKGFTHVSFLNQQGEEVNAEVATQLQAKKLEKIEQKLAGKVLDKVNAKNPDAKPQEGIFDIQQKIAARRKAREVIDQQRKEKFKNAA